MWQQCYSGSNNIHFDFPPIMMDGRNYATWQPEAVVNKRIQKAENIHSNWDYRQYMVHNGLEIMKFNTLQSCEVLGFNPHYNVDTTPSSNVPYTFKNNFDTTKPGFGYRNSDLKDPYLTREQLNAQLISPSIIVPPEFIKHDHNMTPQPISTYKP